MSAVLLLTVKHAIGVGYMSKRRVAKGIAQKGCRAVKSARGDGKFAATMRRLLSSTPVLGIALKPLACQLLALQSTTIPASMRSPFYK